MLIILDINNIILKIQLEITIKILIFRPLPTYT